MYYSFYFLAASYLRSVEEKEFENHYEAASSNKICGH